MLRPIATEATYAGRADWLGWSDVTSWKDQQLSAEHWAFIHGEAIAAVASAVELPWPDMQAARCHLGRRTITGSWFLQLTRVHSYRTCQSER
jgi:hypothetical protein